MTNQITTQVSLVETKKGAKIMKPERIQYELKLRKITQRMIARECGVSDVQVSRVIKHCDQRMSRHIAEAISAHIGKPLEQVFPNYKPQGQAA